MPTSTRKRATPGKRRSEPTPAPLRENPPPVQPQVEPANDPVPTDQTSPRRQPDLLARLQPDARFGPFGWPGLLVALATLAGAILRLVDLSGVPPALNQDEAISAYDAYSLLQTGRDHLGHPFNLIAFESFGDWPPPLHTILSVPLVALAGLDVEAIRAWTALLCLAVVPLVYHLARRLLGRPAAGVIAAWLVALLPWHVHESRWALPPSLVPTVVLLLLLALVWTARDLSERAALWTAVAATAGFATYQTLRLYVPLLAIAALIAWGPRLRRLRPTTLATAALIVGFVAIPTFAFVLLDEAGGSRFEQISVFTDDSLYLPPGTDVDLGFLLGQYGDYFSPRFLFRTGDDDPMHMLPETGVLPVTLFPFMLTGLAWLVWMALRALDPWRRSAARFLLAALLLYPIPGALTLPSPHTLRAAHAIPLFALLAAIGAVAAADGIAWLARGGTPVTRRALLLLGGLTAAVVLSVELTGQYRDYFGDYPDEVMVYFHYGLEDAIAYALEHQAEYDEIWVTSTNQPYIYVLFFGQFSPSDTHRDLVVRRSPPDFNSTIAFQNFRFSPGIRSGPPSDIQPANLPLLTYTTYPNGQPAYEVRGGTVAGRGRVLLIHNP